MPSRAHAPLVAGALLIAGLACAAVLHGDYGVGWDEPVQATYGELALEYFRSGLRDTRCNDFLNLRHYGPLVEMVPAAFYDAGDADRFEVRHLFVASVAALALPLLYLIGRRWPGPLAALAAPLALLAMPRWFGHAFVNSKDVPFAVAFTGFVLALGHAFERGLPTWGRTLLCGVATGAVLAVRPGGLPLVGAFLFLAPALAALAGRRPDPGTAGRWLAGLLARYAAVLLLGWALMVAPWPWAHGDPLRHPIEALRFALAFPDVVYVRFEGVQTPSDALPRTYFPRMLALMTPPSLLALFAVGLVAGARRIARERARACFWPLLALAWLALPLALFFAGRPPVYDGLRHVLFLLPALALWVAVGVATAFRAPGPLRWLLGPAALGLLVWPARDLVRLHPYQQTYYNRFAGGLEGAAERYDTDYWALSYREALAWIGERARERRGERPLSVLVVGNEYLRACVEPYAPEGAELSFTNQASGRPRLPPELDYYVATTRYDAHENFPGAPVVHTIGRDGAVFTVIKGR